MGKLRRIAFIGLVALGSVVTETVLAQTKPNVIVILADDLGTIDLNCYGSDDLATPNLDRLASIGVRFTQFYAVAPVCSPSRAGLLTGKSNLGAGLPGNVPIPEKDTGMAGGLPSTEITMAELLKSSGYYTALVGKWHLGHAPDKLPNAQGFDYFFGHQRGCIDNYSHFFFWSGPNKHDLFQNEKEVYRPGEYFPDLMVAEINAIIDQERSQPFFIYWAANIPHYPYQGTQRWLDYYENVASPRREYAAFVSTLDERIGQVIRKLEETGQLENTVIVFQSDHGHSYEERAFWGGGNSGPYRGGKFSMFEGGIRVPAIISYPGIVPQGVKYDAVASGMDWFPTIAAITGAKYEHQGVEGVNLLPFLQENHRDIPSRELHWQTGSYDDSVSSWAVRKGDWKLLGNPVDSNPHQDADLKVNENRLFLVHLPSDVGEEVNLAGEYPEKVAELLVLHKSWLDSVQR